MEHRKDLEDIIKHYGRQHQTVKALEEMAELTQALAKLMNATSGHEVRVVLDHVREELADTKVMIDQLLIIYGEDNIMQIVKEKIVRQKERMSDE